MRNSPDAFSGGAREEPEEDKDCFLEAKRLYAENHYAEALKLYTELAGKGYSSSQVFLGWMLHSGLGSAKDDDQALAWFIKAANNGSNEGMFYAGRILDNYGRYAEAFEYFRLAAAKDYTPALCRLGLLYLEGRGVVQNRDYADAYFKRAADRGNVFAKRELAAQVLRSGNLLQKIIGGIRFVAAVIEGSVIAMKNPHSEAIKW